MNMCLYGHTHIGNTKQNCVCVTSYLIFIQEHLKLSHTDAKICLIVFVWNVPTERTKLATLLNHRVKETQTEEKPFPFSL